MKQGVVLIGAGGHCKVIIDILTLQGIPICGITDSNLEKIGLDYNGIKVIGNDDLLYSLDAEASRVLICVGSTGDNFLRWDLYNKVKKAGLKLANAIHPSTVLSSSTNLGEGIVIMAGVVVNPCAKIGNNCVLNTGCIVEHDVVLQDNVFIAPGVIIAGSVKVGENTFVGLGAKIIQNVTIGENVLIGAGAVIIDNIPDNSVIMGVPGKIKRYK